MKREWFDNNHLRVEYKVVGLCGLSLFDASHHDGSILRIINGLTQPAFFYNYQFESSSQNGFTPFDYTSRRGNSRQL